MNEPTRSSHLLVANKMWLRTTHSRRTNYSS